MCSRGDNVWEGVHEHWWLLGQHPCNCCSLQCHWTWINGSRCRRQDRFEGATAGGPSADVSFVSSVWQTSGLLLTVRRTTALCLNSCHTKSESKCWPIYDSSVYLPWKAQTSIISPDYLTRGFSSVLLPTLAFDYNHWPKQRDWTSLCYGLNCVSPKKMFWSPNPQYFRMWFYLEIGSL